MSSPQREIHELIGSCFRVPDDRPIDAWASEKVYLGPKATETFVAYLGSVARSIDNTATSVR